MAVAHSTRTTTKPRARPGDRVIAEALRILENRIRKPGAAITSPNDLRAWLALNLAELEHEAFLVIGLDNRYRVIAHEKLFRGTIDGASVHPREVVKWALRHNAAAVVFAHNHPSGVSEPSASDLAMTTRLENILSVVGIRTLDHFIVGGQTITSIREIEEALALQKAKEARALERQAKAAAKKRAGRVKAKPKWEAKR